MFCACCLSSSQSLLCSLVDCRVHLFISQIWWFSFTCQGESFYNPFIPEVLESLSNKGLIEDSEGARVIFIEGKKIPLIVVKSDGGYNYASTDLTALW